MLAAFSAAWHIQMPVGLSLRRSKNGRLPVTIRYRGVRRWKPRCWQTKVCGCHAHYAYGGVALKLVVGLVGELRYVNDGMREVDHRAASALGLSPKVVEGIVIRELQLLGQDGLCMPDDLSLGQLAFERTNVSQESSLKPQLCCGGPEGCCDGRRRG